MPIVEATQAVTVYCPECNAPMHLPNRDLLGCKARCWNCEKKVVLAETQPPAQESTHEEIPPADSIHETIDDADAVPEEFWDEDPQDLPVTVESHPDAESESVGHSEASMAISRAELEQLAQAKPEPQPPQPKKPAPAQIVACGYCQTRIPLIENLLETDGCPCCGSRVASTQYQSVQSQPAWAVENGTITLTEQINGPFGTIYHGQHAEREEPISVRIVPEDSWLPKRRQDLLAGLWRIRQFQHRFAATFDEIGLYKDQVHLIGPQIVGTSLADQIARHTFTPLQVARIGWALADVLEAAHTEGILHRDLKPANIMINSQGVPTLMGFGLPRRRTGGGFLKGPNGLVIGTVGYLAPEQAQGNGPLDPRSDVYSLGVVLYQMLTKQLPFRGTLHQVLSQIHQKPLPAPSKLRTDLSWEWDVLCKNATAKNPQDRYQTAGELRDMLKHIAQSLG